MNRPASTPPTPFDYCQRLFLSGLIFYWFALALVLPITTGDAHTYNLARLAITEQEGFLSDAPWNFEHQAVLPWAFDAVHYPFLHCGAGYSLPSFFTFLGILIVVFQMVASSRGPRTGLWCCLIPFSMPTILFQASTTKNDMILAFCLALWIYALWRWRREKAPRHLFWAALAPAFAAGSKTSGLLLLLPMSAAAAYLLRNHRGLLVRYALVTMAGLLLFGSPETYYRSWKLYGHPLGPPSIRIDHANRDGVKGAAANTLRYVIGNANFAWASVFTTAPSIEAENFCRSFLKKIGLENKGYRPDFSDGNLRFLRNGWESTSDYGPVGFLVLLLSLAVLALAPPRSPPFFLSLTGWAWLLVVSATVAWMPWNNRFLLISFFCFSFSSVLFLCQRPWEIPWFPRFALIGLTGYAVLCPLGSYNRHPGMFAASLQRRADTTTMENPVIGRILGDLSSFFPENPRVTLVLCPGPDSWVLPFYLHPKFTVYNRPNLTPAEFQTLCSIHPPVALLVLDRRSAFPEEKFHVAKIASYPLRTTAFYIPAPGP